MKAVKSLFYSDRYFFPKIGMYQIWGMQPKVSQVSGQKNVTNKRFKGISPPAVNQKITGQTKRFIGLCDYTKIPSTSAKYNG